MSNTNIPQPQKPLADGTFVFQAIQEGTGKGRRVLTFNPPLSVRYTIVKREDVGGQDLEKFPENSRKIGYVTFDFGLSMGALADETNKLTEGYEGLTPESDCVDILMYTVIYDLFHAFCQSPDDHYSHFHWALAGWLKDRTIATTYGDETEEEQT